MRIIIPARRNSKGFPYKNRKLIPFTLRVIPEEYRNDIVVSTDDEWIQEYCSKYKFPFINRPASLADDHSSTKPVLEHAIDFEDIEPDETIVMLYPTYPQRDWSEIEDALVYMNKYNASSLLCKKEVNVHPHLMMFDKEPYGEQLTPHNLYRRQDYPKCFELSHYICIFKAGELNNLNGNLYNRSTVYFQIEDKIDVDTEEDFKKFLKTTI